MEKAAKTESNEGRCFESVMVAWETRIILLTRLFRSRVRRAARVKCGAYSTREGGYNPFVPRYLIINQFTGGIPHDENV